MDYAARLEELRRLHPQPLMPGSDAEQAALDRFRRFFADFSPTKVTRLIDDTYAEDVWFNDTLKTVRGRSALREYLAHSAAAVQSCRVQVHEVIPNGSGDYYVRWSMTIRFKRFKTDRDTHTIGMSHIRFDPAGRVVLHQDYWDSTQGLFEHIPVLGWLIGRIKARL